MAYTTITAATIGLADGDQSPSPVDGTIRITPRFAAAASGAGLIATGPVIVPIAGGAIPKTDIPAQADATALVEFHLYDRDAGPVRMPHTEIPLEPDTTISLNEYLPAGVDPATGQAVARGARGYGIADVNASSGILEFSWEDGKTKHVPIGDLGGVSPTDSRLPSFLPEEEYVASIIDEDGRSTWLAARRSDGGPTDWSEHLIRERLGITQPNHDDYLFALVDSNNFLTDLTIRRSDGRFDDRVVKGLAQRLAPLLPADPGGPTYVDAPYDPSATVLPVHARTDALAGWGSSTIAALNTQMERMVADHGMTWHGGGKGAEGIEHHAARMNAIPARISFPQGVIPASGSVQVTSSNMTPSANLKEFSGHIDGVAGVLSSSASTIMFTRSASGEAVEVDADSEFIAQDGVDHRNDIIIINAGKNNLVAPSAPMSDPETIAAKTIKMVEYQAALCKRVLVLGQFVDTETPAISEIRDRIYQADAILARHLGPTFFDTHAWVTSEQLWIDAEVEPTADDIEQQALGNKPGSVSLNNEHFNSIGYAAYRKQIEATLISLGWIL